MTTWTVHLPRNLSAPEADPLRLVFVKEGFGWPALFIPAIWLLYRRMWLPFLLYAVAGAAVAFAARALGVSGGPLLVVLFALLFALEANQLRRWSLARRGFRLIGVAEGRSRGEAECRFFDRMARSVPVAAGTVSPLPPAPRPAPVYPASLGQTPVVGLFPAPGGTG